jgi:hypothetical protein
MQTVGELIFPNLRTGGREEEKGPFAAMINDD